MRHIKLSRICLGYSMSTNFIVGIDPGKSGGWVILDSKSRILKYGIMPIVGGEIWITQLADLLSPLPAEEVLVVLEKVHSMPKQGVKGVFSFGLGYGKLLGMCQALKLRYELVTPQTWKKLVLQSTKQDKDAAIEFVQRRYPEVNLTPGSKKKPHDGIADALCIAVWATRTQI